MRATMTTFEKLDLAGFSNTFLFMVFSGMTLQQFQRQNVIWVIWFIYNASAFIYHKYRHQYLKERIADSKKL